MSYGFNKGEAGEEIVNGLNLPQASMVQAIDMVLSDVLQQLSNIAMFNSLGEKSFLVKANTIRYVCNMLNAVSKSFIKLSSPSENGSELHVATFTEIFGNQDCKNSHNLKILSQRMDAAEGVEKGSLSGDVLKNLSVFSSYLLQYGMDMAQGAATRDERSVDNQVVNIACVVALYRRYLSMILKGEDLTKRPDVSTNMMHTKTGLDFGDTSALAIVSTVESRVATQMGVDPSVVDTYMSNIDCLSTLVSNIFAKMPKSESYRKMEALFK